MARGLADRVVVRLEGVDEHRGGPYDAVYFSGSFMLLPDPAGAATARVHAPETGGRIWFTQTFEERPSRVIEVLKPLLRVATTIDFGRVTYEADFRRTLAAGGVVLEELEPLRRGPRRTAILAVGRPAQA